MAMVDSHYRFVWGSSGFPGNSRDTVIFRSTDLWNHIKISLNWKNVWDITVQDLIKPYTYAVLTTKQHYVNYHLSRKMVEREGQ